jgi:ketosteroid isomerase-like protein
MTASANKQLVQHIFNELAQGNSKPLVDSMAEEFCWTIPGSTSWSGTYQGKRAVLTRLLGPLRAQMAGKMKTVPQRFIAEGDWVVVEAQGDNTTRSGLAYCNRYCFVVRLAGGQLQELTEYADTALVTQVLQAPEVRDPDPR